MEHRDARHRTTRGRRLIFAALGLAIGYSVVHFALSGVRAPLAAPGIGQVVEEMAPVKAYLGHGRPVEITNPRQYGPVFFAVLHGLLLIAGPDHLLLSRWLYGLQLIMLAVAWGCTVASLRIWLREQPGVDRSWHRGPLLPVTLGLLWLNFSPLYYILTVKNVEGWEVCCMALGLYSHLRGRPWLAGWWLAAAALTKMLPLVFVAYFLVRDWRLVAGWALGMVMILGAAHVVYGPQMGFEYPLLMLQGAAGQTWGMLHHENISLKGMLMKAFAGWQTVHYMVQLEGAALRAASALAHLLQAAGGMWVLWVLARRAHPAAGIPGRAGVTIWEWSFTAVMMLLLSPQTAFEYMLLALPAASFALTAGLASPTLRRAAVAGPLVVALVLTANVAPRQLVNRLLPIAAMNRWTGNEYLTLSEGYQLYGFPLLGLMSLAVAIWGIRRAWLIREHGVAAAPQPVGA